MPRPRCATASRSWWIDPTIAYLSRLRGSIGRLWRPSLERRTPKRSFGYGARQSAAGGGNLSTRHLLLGWHPDPNPPPQAGEGAQQRKALHPHHRLNDGQTKKPGLFDRAFYYFDQRGCLRRFIRDGGVVAIGVGLPLRISVRLDFGLGLDAAARALGELAFDFLDRLGFGHMLHDGDFTRQTIERRLIELTFAVGLFGLRFRAIEIAHHFGDRDDVTGIDLGFIFLGAARPHRALDAGAAFQGLQRALDQSRL